MGQGGGTKQKGKTHKTKTKEEKKKKQRGLEPKKNFKNKRWMKEETIKGGQTKKQKKN
jgi:hypothetical protein